MYLLVVKRLASGKFEMLADEDYDQFKRKFREYLEEWDMSVKNFDQHDGWDYLSAGDLVNYGCLTMQMFTPASLSNATDCIELFDGHTTFVEDIEP